MSSNDVFIVAAARTPIGSFNGTISKLKASDLGSVVIGEVIKRSGIEKEKVNEVIMGQTLAAGQGQNPARQASLKAGLSIDVLSYNINMLCGSSIKSVVLGCQSIRCGDSQIVICGGQESMSLAPHVMHLRQGLKMGSATMLDTVLHDGLTDAMHNIHMGVTSENLSKIYEISREEQDLYAVRSQNRAEAAQKSGYFDREIVPVEIKDQKSTTIFAKDENIRFGTTIESIQNLPPCFINDGTVTAGNCSGLNDCAAAVMLASSAEVEKLSLKPIARIVAWAQTGVDPKIMGIGPVSSVKEVLAKAGWSINDVDLFEINEACAAQSIAVLKGLEIGAEKVNINGGAIALGHPIAASGARILVTLIYALQRTGGRKGIASLCIGGGMGIALAIEIV